MLRRANGKEEVGGGGEAGGPGTHADHVAVAVRHGGGGEVQGAGALADQGGVAGLGAGGVAAHHDGVGEDVRAAGALADQGAFLFCISGFIILPAVL